MSRRVSVGIFLVAVAATAVLLWDLARSSRLVLRLAQRITPASGLLVRRESYDGKQRGNVEYVELTSPGLEQMQAFVAREAAALGVPASREFLYGSDVDDAGGQPRCQEAKDLMTVLRAGELPAPLELDATEDITTASR
jgi:hypothetical protein